MYTLSQLNACFSLFQNISCFSLLSRNLKKLNTRNHNFACCLYGCETSCCLCCSCRWGAVMSLNCGLQPAFPSSSRRYVSVEPQWNDSGRENRRAMRETCHSTNLPITNPTWTAPGANPGFRSERPVSNHLNHGKALCEI